MVRSDKAIKHGEKMSIKQLMSVTLSLVCLGMLNQSQATPVLIVNPGFEDTTGQSVFNEFTFGLPAGWALHDPNNITPSADVFLGTLLPNGTDFFNTTAPEGSRVSILFASAQLGLGEYGYTQTLSTTLQSNSQYNLSVEVGNIASGTTVSEDFFNLSEFPGYRVELLAGGQVLAEDNNTLGASIPEAEFRTSTVSFTTGQTHALLGQDLGIRLVNLNEIPAGFNAGNSPDLEVDFDDVQLNVSAVPLPPALVLFAFALFSLRMILKNRLVR